MPRRRILDHRMLAALLAVVLQVMAPVWASARMVAQDPLAEAAFCGSVNAGHSGTQHRPHAHDAACPACHVCCTGHVALMPVSAAVPSPSRAIIGPSQPNRRTAQPRGPPGATPNARAPPVLS